MHTEHWKTNIHSIIIVHFSGEQRPLPVLGMWGTDRQTMIIDDLIFSITACSIGVVLDSSWRLNNMNSIRSWLVEEHSIIIVSPFFRRALYPGLRSWFSRKNRLFFKNKNRSHIFAPFENKPLSLSNDEFMHIQLPHYEYLVSKRNILWHRAHLADDVIFPTRCNMVDLVWIIVRQIFERVHLHI